MDIAWELAREFFKSWRIMLGSGERVMLFDGDSFEFRWTVRVGKKTAAESYIIPLADACHMGATGEVLGEMVALRMMRKLRLLTE